MWHCPNCRISPACRRPEYTTNPNHHGALARLYGASVVRCAQRRHGQRADSRNADSEHGGRHARAEGAHVASLFCQHFNPLPADGRSWDDLREAAADRVIDTVSGFAPNFRASVLGRMTLTPLDLERRFGLAGGYFPRCAYARPAVQRAAGVGKRELPHAARRIVSVRWRARTRAGGVTGLPGRNAAREIVRDFRRGRVRR